MAEAEVAVEEEQEQKTETETEEEPAPAPEVVAPPPPTVDSRAKWRRLHTISGGVLLALFLVEHLFTNASALGGARMYDSVIGSIERSPILPIAEIIIVVPLLFHMLYGIHLLLRGAKAANEADIDRYGPDRRLWVIQRMSAVLVLVFVLVHLFEFRLSRLFLGTSPDALYTILSAHLSSTWGWVPWIALLYLFGIAAVTFHFANGLFATTAALKIGKQDPAGRRRMRILTSAAGLVLFVVGALTVIGVATGTRLLPGGDADSAACGPSAVPAASLSSRFAPPSPPR
jgi:succinate dehydrogenase / fumarate reductase, cytochrome b subunit